MFGNVNLTKPAHFQLHQNLTEKKPAFKNHKLCRALFAQFNVI